MRRLRLRIKPLLTDTPPSDAAIDPLSTEPPRQSVAVIRIGTLAPHYSLRGVALLIDYAVEHRCQLVLATDRDEDFAFTPHLCDSIALAWDDHSDD